jgi:nitrogen PTS system EIIA component
MKSLLTALEEGRLIELPDNNKDRALQYLASLLEAIPDLRPGTDIAEAVLARERSANTGIGLGWACPHVRTPNDGELLCAVGWSPAGIDYGAADKQPVRLIIMYYIPDSQKNAYLKEISALAKIIQERRGVPDIESARDLTQSGDRLLDLVSAAIEAGVPEAKARMIRLEARQAAVAGVATPFAEIVPVSVVVVPGAKPVVLGQHKLLVAVLESVPDLAGLLAKGNPVEQGDYRLITRAAAPYQPDRIVYDCLAVKLKGQAPAVKPPA